MARSRADARLHVGWHHRARAGRPSTRCGTARSAACSPARAMYMQGVRPGDVVLNSWAYGLHNGAFNFDETLFRWLNCVVLTTSTGNVTSSERQVRARDRVRRDRDPHHRRLPDAPRRRRARDGLRPCPPTSTSRRSPTSATASCSRRPSVPSASTPTASTKCSGSRSSAPSTTACTSSKTRTSCRSSIPRRVSCCPTASRARSASPSSTRPAARSSGTTSWTSRRCTRASSASAGAGCARWRRSPAAADNMVKLRGVNVWPEGVAVVALEVAGAEADWFVRAVRDGNRDEMIFSVTSTEDPSTWPALQRRGRDEAEGPLRCRDRRSRSWRPARSTSGPS